MRCDGLQCVGDRHMFNSPNRFICSLGSNLSRRKTILIVLIACCFAAGTEMFSFQSADNRARLEVTRLPVALAKPLPVGLGLLLRSVDVVGVRVPCLLGCVSQILSQLRHSNSD